MCGIFGKVSIGTLLDVDEHAFRKALDLQSHRGPDNGSVLIDSRIAFGHRRLSIIDLSDNANQPMVSLDGAVVLIFNGEIYNYQEIRNRLISKGHVFNTSSDTEVLLYAYLEYGIECLEQLVGMFAFAIHDRRTAETYIVRDRLGIKPLYYFQEDGTFTFSSEVKSILLLEHNRPSLNLTAVSSYLSFRYPILGDTYFDGIESLNPGCYLKLHGRDVGKHQYWDPSNLIERQSDDRGEDYYVATLRDLLDSAVSYRMIADVPYGAFLSGGVDSSVITAIMAQQSSEPIKTFTIGFGEQGYNEFDYANLIAKKYDTEHREILLSGSDYMTTMTQLIGCKDAPLSVPNEVPLYLMSKELKKYITVVLSGEGADEILGGYGRIFRSTDDYYRSCPDFVSSLAPNDRRIFLERLQKKYGVTQFNGEVDHFLNAYSYTSLADKKRLLSGDIDLDQIEEYFAQKFQSLFDELGSSSYFNKMIWAFIKVHVVGLLHRVDMTTMANAVEARVPFLDHRVVEFALTIPQKYKIKWQHDASKLEARLLLSDEISERYDTPKYILKKAYEGAVPNEVLYRRKMGFPVPLHHWFGANAFDYANDLLLSDQAKNRGIYNMGGVKNWLANDRLREDHGYALKVWMLVNLELFCREYMDS